MGLAILTAVATTEQTQLFADRSALLPAIDPTRPEIAAMTEQGPLGLVGLVQRTQLDVLAASSSDMFLITLWVTVAGVALALLMRGRPPSADAVPEPATGDVRVAAPVPDDRPGSTAATTSGPAPGNGQVDPPAGRETPAPAHR